MRYVFRFGPSFGLALLTELRQLFEGPANVIMVLEQKILEASGFDFRTRHPQDMMLNACATLLGRGDNFNTVTRTAWDMSIDLYKTFAPLKQTITTTAISCLWLACRLHDIGFGADSSDVHGICSVFEGKLVAKPAEILGPSLPH